MTLNQLIYFCRLAETEHYGQAAKALYISQPSLSKAIALLESEMSVSLFERRGRNVALTPAGHTFYEHIKPAIRQIDSARELMQQYSDIHRMPAIGCVSPAITSVLAPLLDSYRMEGHNYPQVTLRVDTSEALISAIRRNECDLAFCTRIPGADDITFLKVASLPFVVVLREDNPLAEYESISPEQLRGHPMAFSNAPAYNAILARIFERYNVRPIVHSYANDDTAMFGMVRAGAAIFITSDYPQIYSNGLAIRRLAQDVCEREIHMAYTERGLLHPVVASFVEFIKAAPHSTAGPAPAAPGGE